jgi:hypothetical protein
MIKLLVFPLHIIVLVTNIEDRFNNNNNKTHWLEVHSTIASPLNIHDHLHLHRTQQTRHSLELEDKTNQ